MPLGQTISSGNYVIVEAAGFTQFIQVSDSAGNDYYMVADDGTASGGVAIFVGRLNSSLLAGDDTINVYFGDGTDPGGGAVWALFTQSVTMLDAAAASHSNNTNHVPSTSITETGQLVGNSDLVVGTVETACTSPSTIAVDGGGLIEADQESNASTVASFDYSTAVGQAGQQMLLQATVTNGTHCQMSGAVAAFYTGPQANPSNLSLTHVNNSQQLTVSWTAGQGNGGINECILEYQDVDSSWNFFDAVDCDQTFSNLAVNLPGDGWVGSWTTPRTVRLTRWDGVVMGYFPQTLVCTPMSGSPNPTPTIDEDCDGVWDNSVCPGFAWTLQNTYSNFQACSNTIDTSPGSPCIAQTVNAIRYTAGTGTSLNPSATWSSDGANATCPGPDPDGGPPGTVEWQCLSVTCSYN